MEKDLENVQRWTAKRRSALILSIIKGETSAREAARKHGLTVAEVSSLVHRGNPVRARRMNCARALACFTPLGIASLGARDRVRLTRVGTPPETSRGERRPASLGTS